MDPIDERDLAKIINCADCSPQRKETLSRRAFIRRTALLSASGIVLLSPHAWAARTLAGSKRRVIVVFLRGAVDGLNVVIPHGESAYYDARPTIAIERASANGGAIDLDGYFALHPALAPLHDAWRDRTLAFVHACGSPDPTRSHFDAQDFMESGTPGVKSTQDGWLNRTLASMPGAHPPTEALSLGPTVPRILKGAQPVANLPLGRAAERPMPLDRPVIDQAFDRLYTGNDALSRVYREGRDSRRRLMNELDKDMTEANAGAPSPKGFSEDTSRMAQLMRSDATIRVGFMALGGWDTHINQGASNGQLANHLRPLANGLVNLQHALGPAYQETVIIVVSEFGRMVHENGNGGTDHGHGNVMWLMGGPVHGGKVYGNWPGLQTAKLYQERDLAVTTDFREPITAVLKTHMRLTDAQIERVFPGLPAPSGNVSGVVTA